MWHNNFIVRPYTNIVWPVAINEYIEIYDRSSIFLHLPEKSSKVIFDDIVKKLKTVCKTSFLSEHTNELNNEYKTYRNT